MSHGVLAAMTTFDSGGQGHSANAVGAAELAVVCSAGALQGPSVTHTYPSVFTRRGRRLGDNGD